MQVVALISPRPVRRTPPGVLESDGSSTTNAPASKARH